MIVGLSAVLTLVLFVFKREILTRFGASEAILPYAESYFTISSAGNGLCVAFDRNEPVYYLPGICADRNAFGGARCGNEYCAGSSVYFVFDMGVAGAAFATVLSQFASAVFVLRFLRGNRVLLRLEFECPQVKTVCKIALMGLSPF